MIQFRLFGVPVTILPWHWVILGLIGALNTGANSQFALLLMGLFVLAGFLSILVHEFGHALSGKMFGARPEIVLHGMGGYAAFPHSRFSRGQDVVVTIAGPAIQLVLAAISWSVLSRFFAGPIENLLPYFFLFLYWVSLFWALLNLIPVFPLDGGRIMFALMGPQRRVLALQVSIAAAVVGGIVLFLWLKTIFFPILLAFMAYENMQELQRSKY